MKILQINNVYDFGSTGRITKDIHLGLLQKGFDSVVYYGRRYKTKDPHVFKICSELYGKAQNGLYRISGVKYGGCIFSTNKLLRAIEREKPDVVHLQCLNGHFVNIYRLVDYLKRNKIPTVLTLHAEFMYTGGCSYALDCEQWRTGCGSAPCPLYKKELRSRMGDRSSIMWERMREAFDGFDRLVVVSVSPWLMDRAKGSAILSDKKHVVIYNGLDTDIFHRYPKDVLDGLRRELGFSADDKIVFHVSPSFDNNPENIKGGFYVLKLSEKLKDLKFVVAGKYDPSLRVPENVKLLGSITDKLRLAMLYAMADVTVLTSKRETFSMVCAESLCCGTPVVGFKAGAPEMISLPAYSAFCEYGDLAALDLLLQEWTQKEKPVSVFEDSHEAYTNARMVDEYINEYQRLSSKL